MQLKMFPGFTLSDAADARLVDTELFSNAFAVHAICTKLSNCENFGISEPRVRIHLSALFLRASIPAVTFLAEIAHIVQLSTREKMLGANAKFDIAMMKHPQPRINRAVGQLVGKSVRRIPGETTIAGGAYGTGPKPTANRRRGFVNLGPKVAYQFNYGIMGRHFLSLLYRFRGVTPKDVSASLRLSYALIIPQSGAL